MRRPFPFLILILTIGFALEGRAQPAARLGTYHIDPARVSVSGVSSGAYMAVQLEVAFSKTFSGVASVAGGLFWCAQGDSKRAQTECMGSPQTLNPKVQQEEARRLAQAGEIDDLTHLAGHRVFIFASPKDAIIHPGNSDKLLEFYQAFVPAANLRSEKTVASAHGFPTLNFGAPCDMGMLPWLLKCQFDLAGEILQSLAGPLNPRGTANPAHLLRFDQSEFGDGPTPLFAEGWVYVPEACDRGQSCGVHVALHGCQMNPDFIRDQFVKNAGYNEWAEANRLIVLYPQSAKVAKVNPYACWDWFGFTGPKYVTRSGAQMAALMKMVHRLGVP